MGRRGPRESGVAGLVQVLVVRARAWCKLRLSGTGSPVQVTRPRLRARTPPRVLGRWSAAGRLGSCCTGSRPKSRRSWLLVRGLCHRVKAYTAPSTQDVFESQVPKSMLDSPTPHPTPSIPPRLPAYMQAPYCAGEQRQQPLPEYMNTAAGTRPSVRFPRTPTISPAPQAQPQAQLQA